MKIPSHILHRVLLLGAAILLSIQPANADTLFWGILTPDQTADESSWQDATHWFQNAAGTIPAAAAPDADDDAVFSITDLNDDAITPRLFAETTIDSITFNNTVDLNLQGGGANRVLHIGGGGLTANGASVVMGTSTANRNIAVRILESQTWTNNGSGTLRVRNNAAASDNAAGDVVLTLNAAGNGTITNSGNFADGAAGSLGLIVDSTGSGVVNISSSTFTGGTTIRRGILQVDGGAQIGAEAVTLGHTSGDGDATLRVNTASAPLNDVTVAAGNTGISTLEFTSSSGGNFAGDIILNKELNVGVRDGETVTITGSISAGGSLVKGQHQGGNSGTLILQAANTYTGSTTVSNDTLIAEVDNSLGGTSSVTIDGSANLTLGTGVATATGFINDFANVILNGSSSTMNLNYLGSDVIGGLQANGFTFAPGTYTADDANAFAQSSQFSGLGTLTVIPEPSTFAMLVGGLGMLVGFQRTRRQRR